MKARADKRPPWNPHRVSASRLAQLGWCELKLVLDERHGERVSVEQQAYRDVGTKTHAVLHQRAKTFHNRPNPPSPVADPVIRNRKGPCFIATVMYGYDDPRTQHLRRFRDQVLRRTASGRRCIGFYYRHAPTLAHWLKGHRRVAMLVRMVLDGLRCVLPGRE